MTAAGGETLRAGLRHSLPELGDRRNRCREAFHCSTTLVRPATLPCPFVSINAEIGIELQNIVAQVRVVRSNFRPAAPATLPVVGQRVFLASSLACIKSRVPAVKNLPGWNSPISQPSY
jgi:hypothetical protein